MKEHIYLTINNNVDLTGMEAIAFVDAPAIEINWNAFNKHQSRFAKNEAKRIVTGPVMLAETDIFRISPKLGEYYIRFSAETILEMVERYFEQLKINQVNEMHNPKKPIKDVVMIESFIVNERTKSELYPDLPFGSWICSFKINCDKTWDKIMRGQFKGFSLEGYFIEQYENNLIEETYSKIESLLNDVNISDTQRINDISKLLKTINL